MWEFACLPFGLASAPRVFTKLLNPVVAVLRQMGLRIIIYLDDILIMSKSYDLALTPASTALNLLEGLGCVVNFEKSCLEPSQIIEFLGFEINSQTLTILLPRDKIRKIRKKCQDLLDNPNTSVRELSKFLGLLTSSIQAIFSAPLHYRNLQFAKNQALSQSRSYETIVRLSHQAVQEIQWWKDHLIAWNGRAILRQPIQLTIETDASTKGWDAHCQGISTGGRWSPEEKELHINCLELLAGSLAVKTFAKGMGKVHILLLMDSVSAVSYINKLGGGGTLNSLAHDLWTWCLANHVNFTAQHIPGVTNTLADWQSRVFQDSSDWKLNPQVFAAITKLWGPLGIDLFASRLTRQLPNFVSWKPDPEALGTDAFALDWNQWKGYAFPPFSLIGRCRRQVQVQQVAELVIVTPVLPAQAWYPLLLELCIDYPVLLPQDPSLLMRGQEVQPLDHRHLAGWLVSIDHSKRRKFLQRLGKSFYQPGAPILPSLIHQPGTSGIAGVWNTTVVPFHHLSQQF